MAELGGWFGRKGVAWQRDAGGGAAPGLPTIMDARDYETVAARFGLTSLDAAHLLGLLRDCFSLEGGFSRSLFEKRLDDFARHKQRGFEFLWHSLKDLRRRDDRVAALNSLQVLYNRLGRPSGAVKTLLDSLITPPDAVGWADRNALVLANILIRKYNQELTSHIESTPEEVLLVHEGLDEGLAREAAAFVDRRQVRFTDKMDLVHQGLRLACLGQKTDGNLPPPKYLATVAREAYIHLALIGGRAAGRLVRRAVKLMGDPGSDIYGLKNSRDYLRTHLQLLQVCVRGLVRFDNPLDAEILKAVNEARIGFMVMDRRDEHRELVERVWRHVDSAARQAAANGTEGAGE